MKSGSHYFKIFAAVCLSAVLFLKFIPIAVSAEEQKIIKVGYESTKGYEEGGPGEYKTGFGYEYLQKIAYYTGWKYEYVYGTFTDLIGMLEKGEIDLLGDVAYTDERANKMLYSNYAQGIERYYIFKLPGRSDIEEDKPETLTGKIIGATKNTVQNKQCREWLENNNIEAHIIEYNGIDTTIQALYDGHVDAIVMTDVAGGYGYEPEFEIGYEEFYFAVNKKRSDLCEELNYAMGKILMTEPNYNTTVFSKYTTGNVRDRSLNNEDKRWLSEHNNTIRIGHLKDDLPYAGTDSDGELTGILINVKNKLTENFGINVETKSYNTIPEVMEAAKRGEIDVWGPWYGDFYMSEIQNVIQTEPIQITTVVYLFEGNEPKFDRIAVTDKSVFYSDIIQVRHPEASLVYCSDLHECVHTILAGRADVTIVASGKISLLKQYDGCFDNLNSAEKSQKEDVCMFMNRDDSALLSIMNKGINIASAELDGVSFMNYAFYDAKKSYVDFMKDHPGVTASIATMLFSSVLATVIILIYNRKIRKKDMLLEKALVQAEAANVAKSSFFSKMSHDMRTPLNGIIGTLEINKSHSDDIEFITANEKKAEIAAKHLLSLINDVLDMSKIEDGSVVVSREGFHIIELTDEIMIIMRPFAEPYKVTINVSATHDLLAQPFLFGSPLHIKKIFTNLISNCVKYNKENGTVDIFAEIANEDEKNLTIRWTIKDTGIGMSKEYIDKIFEPFSQESTDARSIYNGTGLGMSITKALIEIMNGTIEVSSEQGVGSTFVVTIPFEKAMESDIPGRIVVEKESIENVKVLLVEDNELNREIAEILLEDEGAVVTSVTNGKEALDLFNSEPAGTFDIILMDLLMPVMGGLDATRAIRNLERPDAMSIPIVAMTANAFSDDIKNCLEAGMDAHLAKPIEVDKMIKTIAKFVH